ncbi:DUF4383 domain-containing protein [Streptomyces sp. NPDC001205]
MATITLHGRRLRWRHVMLDEHLPVDHRLSQIYRAGAAGVGLFLIVFGVLGLMHWIGFFATGAHRVLGLNGNGALSVASLIVGGVLLAAAGIGGNTASSITMLFGVAFLVVGFAGLAALDTRFNFLAFRIQNVLFSFLVGLLLVTFGMYGRVSGSLPHDNPYWQSRHPGPQTQNVRLDRLVTNPGGELPVSRSGSGRGGA